MAQTDYPNSLLAALLASSLTPPILCSAARPIFIKPKSDHAML